MTTPGLRLQPTPLALALGHPARVVLVWMLTLALTAAGVLLGLLVPALAPRGTPHATLHGTAGEAAGILLHNLRVLAAPVILAGARWAEQRVTRLAGDAIVAAVVVANPLVVGAAVGRHGAELVRFLPHVPLEWAALSIAATTWMSARRSDRLSVRALVAYAIAVVAAGGIAATVETVAAPHASRGGVDRGVDQRVYGRVDFQSTLRPPPARYAAVRRSAGFAGDHAARGVALRALRRRAAECPLGGR